MLCHNGEANVDYKRLGWLEWHPATMGTDCPRACSAACCSSSLVWHLAGWEMPVKGPIHPVQAIIEAAQLKAEGKVKKVVVTGCLAQRYSNELAGAQGRPASAALE